MTTTAPVLPSAALGAARWLWLSGEAMGSIPGQRRTALTAGVLQVGRSRRGGEVAVHDRRLVMTFTCGGSMPLDARLKGFAFVDQ
jgi:hypothetical protein